MVLLVTASIMAWPLADLLLGPRLTLFGMMAAGTAGAGRDTMIVAADKAGIEGEARAMTVGSPKCSCPRLT